MGGWQEAKELKEDYNEEALCCSGRPAAANTVLFTDIWNIRRGGK
jgi:hypothetical protein